MMRGEIIKVRHFIAFVPISSLAIFVFVYIGASLFMTHHVSAQCSSIEATGTGANNNCTDANSWSNPTRIVSSNDSWATTNDYSSNLSDCLHASNFEFDIPSNAKIVGVEVKIERHFSYGGSNGNQREVRDYDVRLLNASGTTVGNNLANINDDWPLTNDAVTAYGSSSNLWGATLTPAIINDPDFGLRLQVQRVNGNQGNPTARVDFIEMTVYFTLSTTISVATSVCASSTGNAASVNVTGATAWDWTISGGTIISGAGTSNITYTAGSGSSINLDVTVTTPDGNCTTGSSIIQINPLPVAPTSASSDRNIFCADDAGTISLSVAGGVGTTVRWFAGSCGGVEIGTGNPLVINSPINSTTYYARWESNCGNSSCASVNVNVTPNLPVGVTISANPSGAVCAGTSVTYTATPTNGGTNPIYQWKVNGTNVGTNNNQYTYEPADGDAVSCLLTSDAECAEGLTTTPILYFSWNDNAKALTDSDFGSDAISITDGQYKTGGVGGTSCLAPVAQNANVNLTFDGSAPEFNGDGIDYSISYRRDESIGQLFTRGQSLIITGGANFSVSYRLNDGAGSYTTVNSGNIHAIPVDGNFHNYRFKYDPSDGYGRLYVGGSQVWQSPTATPGMSLYWTGAGNVIIGMETDASGNQTPTFDDLLMSTIRLKSATGQLTAAVNALTPSPTGMANQSFCSGSNVADLAATGTSIQWFLSETGGTPLVVGTTLTTGNYYASQTVDGCESMERLLVAVTINPLPTPAIAPTNEESCATNDVVYTTEAGQANYVWATPGSVLNTDYTVTAGGTATDNSITLKWITAGNKVVSVNYTNAHGCSAATATSSTVTVHPMPAIGSFN